jgi:hypothetical protein
MGHLLADRLGIPEPILPNPRPERDVRPAPWPPSPRSNPRYVYRLLTRHPLIDLSPSCSINGRIFDEEAVFTTVLRFDPPDLAGDGDELMWAIEAASF